MIKKWYYIPALIFLLLTLISGVWLRLQWGWPQWMTFRTDFLTHGHSHVALLGWVFLGMMGLVFEAGAHRPQLPQRMIAGLGGLVTLLTLILFASFTLGGYTPLSIILSTIHMVFGYALAWIFFRFARDDRNIGSRYFIEGAVFWMVMATAGPWLLAVGRGLPPFWMDAAVHYYLHVLFNGWFLFALAGLSWRYLVNRQYYRTVWPFWLMMIGLIPSLIPQLPLSEPSYLIVWTGISGTILFAAGGLAVIIYTAGSLLRVRGKRDLDRWIYIPAASASRNHRWICKELLWAGLTAAVPVLLLPIVMSWPALREILTRSEFLVIGFIHLHLLVVVSTLLLFGIVQRLYGARIPIAGEKFRIPARIPGILRAGSITYLLGSVSMAAILILTGVMQITGTIPPYPVQKTLFYSGIVTLSGSVLIIFAIVRVYVKRRRGSRNSNRL